MNFQKFNLSILILDLTCIDFEIKSYHYLIQRKLFFLNLRKINNNIL